MSAEADAPASRNPTPARTRRLIAYGLLLGGAAIALTAGGVALRRKPKPKPQPQVQQQTFDPELERRSFTVASGFRIELVASEPLVHEPVALAFDPKGRVWVCEMEGYMTRAKSGEEPQPLGRIVILEDTDGDGRLDKRTVFLDKLVLPRAISLVKDGALVAEPPTLWYCPDRNGDGVADEKIEVDPRYTLTRGTNPEHLPNALLLGLDNRIYNADSDVCYELDEKGQFERKETAFRGQWGLAKDDWGRLFYSYNLVHLRSDILASSHYLERNRFYRNTIGVDHPVASDEHVYPSHPTPGVASGEEALQEGKLKEFTAACGPAIYRGDLFPAEYRGNAFVCEPAGNLVKRDVLREENGLTYATRTAAGPEFLSSSDERFRPVNLYSGPDGALWVADMYRGIIEHEKFMSRYLRDYIRQHGLAKPTGLGRIWRIVPEGAAAGALPKLPQDSASLVKLLEHPNGWQRDTAQRLLVERRDPSVVPALRQLCQASSNPLARLHAAWTLDGMRQLDQPTVERLLADEDPKLRSTAIRLCEPWLKEDVSLQQRLLGLVHDQPRVVALQLMLTLGELQTPDAMSGLLALLEETGAPYYLQQAAVTGLGGREIEFLQLMFNSSRLGPDELDGMVRELATSILNERQPERCEQLLAFVTGQPAPRQAKLIAGIATAPQVTLSGFRPIALPTAPPAWEGLAQGCEADLLAKVSNLFSWPGKLSPLEPHPEPLTAAQQASFAAGEALYQQTCAACHQPSGSGQPGLAPPLVNSEWVLGRADNLARILLHGLAGEIDVAGRTYHLEMPPFENFTDQQIASVLTYVRRAWGHTAAPVETEEVATVRTKSANRSRPWTARGLDTVK